MDKVGIKGVDAPHGQKAGTKVPDDVISNVRLFLSAMNLSATEKMPTVSPSCDGTVAVEWAEVLVHFYPGPLWLVTVVGDSLEPSISSASSTQKLPFTEFQFSAGGATEAVAQAAVVARSMMKPRAEE
ncbi:Hypothetical protein UVM_LOCUS346 [uncultured virus]|nr:Hypothetical protein UVM_LOCUS346 [uncultured virus]